MIAVGFSHGTQTKHEVWSRGATTERLIAQATLEAPCPVQFRLPQHLPSV
jgi:hypothetical protein